MATESKGGEEMIYGNNGIKHLEQLSIPLWYDKVHDFGGTRWANTARTSIWANCICNCFGVGKGYFDLKVAQNSLRSQQFLWQSIFDFYVKPYTETNDNDSNFLNDPPTLDDHREIFNVLENVEITLNNSKILNIFKPPLISIKVKNKAWMPQPSGHKQFIETMKWDKTAPNEMKTIHNKNVLLASNKQERIQHGNNNNKFDIATVKNEIGFVIDNIKPNFKATEEHNAKKYVKGSWRFFSHLTDSAGPAKSEKYKYLPERLHSVQQATGNFRSTVFPYITVPQNMLHPHRKNNTVFDDPHNITYYMKITLIRRHDPNIELGLEGDGGRLMTFTILEPVYNDEDNKHNPENWNEICSWPLYRQEEYGNVAKDERLPNEVNLLSSFISIIISSTQHHKNTDGKIDEKAIKESIFNIYRFDLGDDETIQNTLMTLKNESKQNTRILCRIWKAFCKLSERTFMGDSYSSPTNERGEPSMTNDDFEIKKRYASFLFACWSQLKTMGDYFLLQESNFIKRIPTRIKNNDGDELSNDRKFINTYNPVIFTNDKWLRWGQALFFDPKDSYVNFDNGKGYQNSNTNLQDDNGNNTTDNGLNPYRSRQSVDKFPFGVNTPGVASSKTAYYQQIGQTTNWRDNQRHVGGGGDDDKKKSSAVALTVPSTPRQFPRRSKTPERKSKGKYDKKGLYNVAPLGEKNDDDMIIEDRTGYNLENDDEILGTEWSKKEMYDWLNTIYDNSNELLKEDIMKDYSSPRLKTLYERMNMDYFDFFQKLLKEEEVGKTERFNTPEAFEKSINICLLYLKSTLKSPDDPYEPDYQENIKCNFDLFYETHCCNGNIGPGTKKMKVCKICSTKSCICCCCATVKTGGKKKTKKKRKRRKKTKRRKKKIKKRKKSKRRKKRKRKRRTRKY